eukprot:6164818-Prymnesium_polylepis.1
MMDRLADRLEGEGAERAQRVLCSMLRSRGACVCFACATPVLVQLFASAQARRRADSSANTAECEDAAADAAMP